MSSMLNHALPWIYHGFKWRMVPSYSTHHHHIKVNTVRRFNKVICLVVINYWTLLIINLHEEHKQGWRVPATRKIHVTSDKSICKIRIHIIRSLKTMLLKIFNLNEEKISFTWDIWFSITWIPSWEMYLTRVEGTSLKETLCYSRYLILVSICCKKLPY